MVFDQKEMMISDLLEIFTHRFAKWAGSASGFVAALLSILIWLVAGLVYGFSQNWERGLLIYIGVITFAARQGLVQPRVTVLG